MSEYVELEVPEVNIPEKFSLKIDVSSDGKTVFCTAINNDTNFGSAIDSSITKYASKMEIIIDTILTNIIEVI